MKAKKRRVSFKLYRRKEKWFGGKIRKKELFTKQ